MIEVTYEHALPEPGPRRKGFTQTLRDMHRGGSIDLPLSKRASVYSAARAAGVKVRTQLVDKGVVRVWRADGPERPSDIFGQPIKAEIFK